MNVVKYYTLKVGIYFSIWMFSIESHNLQHIFSLEDINMGKGGEMLKIYFYQRNFVIHRSNPDIWL